jgi:hypothetical protein
MTGVNTSRWTLLWMTAYAVAMGVLEAAVVIYLRRLYFPGGFRFPMRLVETDIMIVELWRELATLMMLASVGAIAGRNRAERFGYFLFAFGIWDLVYYGFLKLALDWPESLLTWDILFLLPVPWVGPVLAPCVVAATMIGLGLTVVRLTDHGVPAAMLPRERALLWSGAAVIVISFTLDWTQVDGPTLWQNIIEDRDLLYGLGNYVPRYFPWWIFALGELMVLSAWMVYGRRTLAIARAR